MSNKDEAAFPVLTGIYDNREGSCYLTESSGGLTKREYAAIQIMAGCSSNPDYICSGKELAKVAVETADALLAELEKEPT